MFSICGSGQRKLGQYKKKFQKKLKEEITTKADQRCTHKYHWGGPEGGGTATNLSPKMLADIGSVNLTLYLCKSFIVSNPPTFRTYNQM